MADVTQAYCSVDDVEELTQVAAYSVTTKPSLADVEGFCRKRASTVYGWVRAVMGSAAQGPNGYATPIDSSTDAGLALGQACRQANAVGAAIDALEAAGIGDEPEASDRTERLRARFDRAEGSDNPSPLEQAVMEAAQAVVGRSERSATHVSKEMAAASSEAMLIPSSEPGLTFDSETEW